MLRVARIDGLKALVAIAATALAMLAVAVPLLASKIDRQSASYETQLVRSGYAAAIGDRLAQVESESIWDELLEHTDPHVDAAWLDINIASPSDWDTFGAIVTIIGADGHMRFSREQASGIATIRLAEIARVLQPIITRLRAREAATVQQRSHPGPPLLRDRVSLAATVIVQGQAFAALACRIDSATGRIARPHGRAPIMAVLVAVDHRMLPAMAKDLLLTDYKLTLGAAQPGSASISLDDVEGHSLATLGWKAIHPGTDLLKGTLPGIMAVLAVLSLAVIFAYRRTVHGALALAASEARAQHLAFHDQLTELPNRRFIQDRLVHAVRHARQSGETGAVLLINLDQFKTINETHGHSCGDELILEVARRLVRICRGMDVCARLGGDEFAILATGCRPEEAALLAQRAVACIAEPIRLSVATVQIGGSIGIGVFPNPAYDEHELLRQADLALHRVKEGQVGAYGFYDTSLDEALQHRLGLEADLRRALRDGMIRVAYQPQFRAGVLTGAEALARWTDPERGPVSPACFIQVAERCGLIDKLGLHVMAQAFLDGRRWPKLSIAVNLSAVQIGAPDFLPALERLVLQYGVRTAQFELEITESVLMAEEAGVLRTLSKLRSMGFRLALDDFGTGYSSLSYLRRFPIDKIKIDRSFVTPLPDDPVSVSLVRVIIGLAEALGLEIIAEGVETAGQRESLASMGCHTVQGYLTGRPMSATELDCLLTDDAKLSSSHTRQPPRRTSVSGRQLRAPFKTSDRNSAGLL